MPVQPIGGKIGTPRETWRATVDGPLVQVCSMNQPRSVGNRGRPFSYVSSRVKMCIDLNTIGSIDSVDGLGRRRDV